MKKKKRMDHFPCHRSLFSIQTGSSIGPERPIYLLIRDFFYWEMGKSCFDPFSYWPDKQKTET